MQKTSDGYFYSPSDLIAFLDNQAVTWLDRLALERPGLLTRDEAEEAQELVRQSGDEHERRFLETLRATGAVVEIDRGDRDALRKTQAAMLAGQEVIYQARLAHGEFSGWADFLFRVDGPSDLGSYHYEVWDTKLARGMKPYFAIQLCCYAEMLAPLQGLRPPNAGIVLGSGRRQPLRLDDFWYYYQAVKRAFLGQQRGFDPDQTPPFPGMADYRHWSGHVTQLLEARDDVSFTANITTPQIQKLNAAGIVTLLGLAESRCATVPRMARPTLERLRRQARLQRKAEPGQPPPYELLNPESPAHGFGLLPPASPADVCFDMEGYPLADGGLEYLFGATHSERGQLQFRDWWAHDPQKERAAFEGFIDWVYARWRRDPSMHIYHYAAYEPAAVKRLMCRYATREHEVDELLRHHVFVDLYRIVRQALLVGEPAYSLKNVEHLYLPARGTEVATAGDSIVYYHRWLISPDGGTWRESPTLRMIRDYNQADCDSTWGLVEWLRARQSECGQAYVAPPPPAEVNEQLTARAALAREMLAGLDLAPSLPPERRRVTELLAHLIEFHRRELKSRYWAMFERAAMTEQELIEDADCLAGLQRTKRPPVPDKQSFIYEYEFPEQETKPRAGDRVLLAADTRTRLVIETFDADARKLTLRRGKKHGALPDYLSLLPDEIVDPKTMVQSIERTVRAFHAGAALPPALEDFLYRRPPRCQGLPDPLAAALSLNNSALCIQGPPGCGKTLTGGRLIAALIQQGKRVAVASNSHHAIALLMKSALDAAAELGLEVSAVKCGENGADQLPAGVDVVDNSGLFDLHPLPELAGGTAWVFSRAEAAGLFDYLFIDEAGQVSVANLVAMAPAAANLVLLGDQMQLSQPIQGLHPGESGLSVLDYFLEDHATVPEGRGVFLPDTYRLHPELCEFISSAIYENRLHADKCTSRRAIRFDHAPQLVPVPAGLVYVPVEHDGNSYESPEEVDAVRRIIGELTQQSLLLPGHRARRLGLQDILVVAPFNLQVQALQTALPGVRVGTVDKFQGQQAPVVIFSMAASEGRAVPRGIEFLFDPHRMNVALSRAQILAVLVASPALERTSCSTLEQMRVVNLFCRAAQEGLPQRRRIAGR